MMSGQFKTRTAGVAHSFTAMLVTLASIGLVTTAQAQQTFTATVDGQTWESDNDGINVIPVALGTSTGTVTITAITKGFSAYPQPKGYSDTLSIVCPKPKKPERFLTTGMEQSKCRVSFTKAARSMMSPDYARIKNEGEYESTGAADGNGYVNFTKVSGKTIEGEFSVKLIDATSKKKMAISGKFSGLDKQMDSKGFN